MESLVKKNNLKVSAIYTIYKSSKGFGNAQFDLKARDCQLTQKQFLFQLNLDVLSHSRPLFLKKLKTQAILLFQILQRNQILILPSQYLLVDTGQTLKTLSMNENVFVNFNPLPPSGSL